MEVLSERRREILNLAAEGKTDKEIARELGIGLETVLSHWKEMRTKFGASSRTQVLAKILTTQTAANQHLHKSERDELLFQLAESSRLRQELEEANRRLADFAERQASMLQETMKVADRKLTSVLGRLQRLEKLDAHSKVLRVILHSGEYGASWRKFFVSDSICMTGTNAEDWEAGSVTSSS